MRHAILALLSVAVIGSSMAGFQQSGDQQTTVPIPVPKLYVAFTGDGAGFIDAFGEWVIKPTFSDAYEFVGGRAVVAKDEKYFLINRNGATIFEFPENYQWIGEFGNGLAPVFDGTNIGYINLDGQVVVDFEYDWVVLEFVTGAFNDGLAVVEKDGKMGAINPMGRVVIPLEFEYIWDFSDGAALAKKGDQEGAINAFGRFIFQDSEDAYIVDEFHNGLAPAVIEDFVAAGFIDKRGNWAIEPKFDVVGLFDGVYAAAVVDDMIGFIDRAGEWVIEPAFPLNEDHEERFTGRFETEDSLCWVPLDEDHFGFIDKTGAVVIDGGFLYADNFKDGLALVFTDVHIGYINTKGEWIYQVRLDELDFGGLLTAFGF